MNVSDPLRLHGINVPIGIKDVSPVIWHSLSDGSYEAKEAYQVPKCLQERDRILELGAGIGIITTLMAQVPEVVIWSFDANPATVELAKRVAEANGITNVVFAHGLLSAGSPTKEVFYIREDFWMSSLTEHQGPYLFTIDLQSINIDKFLEQNNINVLVMDVEGAEYQILTDAKLGRIDRIILELHDHIYGLSGVGHIFDAMHQKGFAYDPRGSSGPCILFRKDDGSVRPYVE